ncbi:MAG: hypothetical protein IT331_19610 [Anaerolineae bacterium]|nr:hypothetical protein [Anaerolineae bacterium]
MTRFTAKRNPTPPDKGPVTARPRLTNAGIYIFRPRVAFACKQFPSDVTRWELNP